MKRAVIVIVIVVGIVVLAVLKLAANKQKAEDKIFVNDATAAIFVEAGSPQDHTFEDALSFLGTFDAYRQNTIGSDASGKIIKLNVEEGDQVAQGS